MDFSNFIENDVKGAFRDFPIEQQPVRIPLNKFESLANKVRELLSPIGVVFIPDATKKIKKDTTGDLDVLFAPYNIKDWTKEVKKVIPGIVAESKNGPQLMLVVKGLVDDSQYMIDIILTNKEDWQFATTYYRFGPIIPVILGSFSRMLGYKFAQDGLYIRLKDIKNNYHNIKLTGDPAIAFEIMYLDPSILHSDHLYDPDKVAAWVLSSPRFDSQKWLSTEKIDGITVKNYKSHRAARVKPDVVRAYEIIDSANKNATIVNSNMEIERRILGNQKVEDILQQAHTLVQKAENAPLNGHEVMQILKIPSGPMIGKWVNWLKNHPQLVGRDFTSPDIKQLATQLLRQEQK